MRHLLVLLLALSASTALAQPARRGRAAATDAPAQPRVTLADLEGILPRLRSNDADQVREAIDLLTIIDRPEVVPPLAELVRAGQSDVITDRAIGALERIAEPSSIDLLTELLNHRRPGARRRAYAALAAIDDPRVRPLLERGLRDSDRSVRGAAALALGEIGAKQSLDLLFRAFERNVVEAAIAIGKLGDAESVERYHAFLGQEPLGVMLTGYDAFLRRSDVPLATKKAIVERLGEVAGVSVRRFLQDYLASFPERIRDRGQRELKTLVEQTIARIPETAAGVRVGGGA
ncbi:MAG: HEAT repeat domain-containing protein [Sandaracinus sp.]|nr:HEAT repeat domain-containing protein [Sandaracinus sp.]MCB9635132.1 HEAT repeat domain-containing protein [Sandaracinus sp.]